MVDDYLKDFLRGTEKLNPARLGSFGEFVFVATVNDAGSSVEPWHQDETDYIVDGLRIDVKATAQKLDQPRDPLVPYKGKRAEGVSYAKVEFFDAGTRVSIEGDEVGFLDWKKLHDLWHEWSKVRATMTGGGGATKSEAKAAREKQLAPIRQEIEDFFAGVGYEVRLIHRTVQTKFGKETADNMIPQNPKEGRILVYLDFRSAEVFRHNLKKVYSYPESSRAELPTLEFSRLHKKNVVDRDQVPEKFCFDDIDDLKANWERMLS